MHPQSISERFVRYYQNSGFKLLSGTLLLHPSIPMTFVMSAGLAQIETAIKQLGHQSPNDDYVLVQNCFRHFDVDKIGKSGFHLSLFEMPGAFSFGHNSRHVTIQRMWDLLTHELNLAPDCLWATYFTGGQIAGHFFAEDTETRRTWEQIGLPSERIVGLGVAHNFWKQGGGIDDQETSRKCGPNTELFFDRGFQWSCSPDCRPGCECGRFIEFANSLFIFAEIDANTNKLSLMAEPFTETVIGVERVAMILAGRSTVFEIETIHPLIDTLRSFYKDPSANASNYADSEHILIDHLRALVFLAADGAPPPGKGGRRRLMRILIRRVLTQMRVLPVASSGCLTALIDEVVALNRLRQPNLSRGREILLAYFETETPAFNETLTRGYRQLDRLLARKNGHILDSSQLVSLV